MKVYLWLGHAPEGHPERPWVTQCDCIVAAKSKAEVGRILGFDPRRLFNLEETGNAEQIEVATAKPGTIFWRHINDHHGTWKERINPETASLF